jgi:UPF0716 protein FxsA
VGLWLFLIFVALPILEIALFILVGGAIGVLPTLMLVVLAAVAGLVVIRAQGLNALARLEAAIDHGDNPAGPIANGALKVIAGLLLVVPGFFTDALGLLLLLPPVRRALMRRGAARVTVRATAYARARRAGPARPAETIDADYEIIGEQPRPPASGWTRQP